MATTDSRHYTSQEGATPEEAELLAKGGLPQTPHVLRALRLGISDGYADGFAYGRERGAAGSADRI